MKIRLLAPLFPLVLMACSTVSTPVLRHETGDTLGNPGKLRAHIKLESSRLFPVVPPDSPAIGTEQLGEIYQASLFGFQGTIAAHQRVDLSIGGVIFRKGGGWRLSGKYAVLKKGNLSGAATLGYGVYSSSGVVAYSTPAELAEVDQTLTVSTIDLAAPFSYKLTPTITAYGGMFFLINNIAGAASSVAVAQTPFDIGVNLGGKLLLFGRVEAELEMAILRTYDYFSDSSRMIPYFGLGVGVLF